MSAHSKTIEGTWEELLKRQSELAGHHISLTVLDDDAEWANHPAFNASPAAIEEWVKNFKSHLEKRPVSGALEDERDTLYTEQLDHQL